VANTVDIFVELSKGNFLWVLEKTNYVGEGSKQFW